MDRLRKADDAVDEGNEHMLNEGNERILNAPRLGLRHHAVTGLGKLGRLDPQPQDLVAATRGDPSGERDRFVPNRALVAIPDPQRVEDDYGIAPAERSPLPRGDVGAHLIHDGTDEPRLDVDLVELLQVLLDLARSNAMIRLLRATPRSAPSPNGERVPR